MHNDKTPGFPLTRMRRRRRHGWLRDMLAEHTLSPADFIYPVFMTEGENTEVEVPSMPGVRRRSIDKLIEHLAEVVALGIPAVVLFPVVGAEHKSEDGGACCDDDGLVPNTIRAIKAAYPDLGVITDVALDPYTTHGQDGVIDEAGYVLNDVTVAMLERQALCHARAGADIVAPSDMMDGRVGALRRALEVNGFNNTLILSYAAKYASSFYGPFRDAVGSAGNLGGGGKHSYQMDPANSHEALREVELDVLEGADLVMVKPALPYLDIIRRVNDAFEIPVTAYHVSGEYAMLKAAAANGWLDARSTTLEALLSIKRAGARAILTYSAIEASRWLLETKN
ncbi:MAG: porphobilinogen synthase [Pseudomonadota bacterium]